MMKKFITIMALFIWMINEAQDLGIGASLPQITRPEASVANLMTFEEIPVTNYTGIPNVSVPLFSLATRSKDVALNMGLAYHPANAVMYEAQAGDCGLGWSLFAGGSISRTLVGTPDEYGNSYDDATKRDIYQFNFMGHSGRFFINKETNGSLSIKVLDNANSKLVFHLDYNQTTYVINSITVFDKKGYRFVFVESDTQYYVESLPQEILLPVFYKSSFHLTSVHDNNNQELISISYNEYLLQLATAGSHFQHKYKKINEALAKGYGKVKINYSAGASLTYDENMKITGFELFDVNNNVIKRINMQYIENNLSKVEALSPNQTIKDSYSFNYNNNEIIEGTLSNDRWGYNSFEPECLFEYPIEIINEPIFTKYITKGILDRINLPTGGKIRFNYEPNEFSIYKKNTLGIWEHDEQAVDYKNEIYNQNFETIIHNVFLGVGNNTITFTAPNFNPETEKYYFTAKTESYLESETVPPGFQVPNPNQVHYPIIRINGIDVTNQNNENMCLGADNFGGWSIQPNQTYTVTIDAMTEYLKKGTFHLIKKSIKQNLNFSISGAGIRIKDISYYDNINSSIPSRRKNYTYNIIGMNRTSGVVSYPHFDENTNNLVKREPVGYKNVTVYETGLGRQEFTYTTPLDFDVTPTTNPLAVTYYDYRRGLLLNHKTFSENNVELVENEYLYDYVEDADPTQFYNNPALNERLGWAKLTRKTTKNYFSNYHEPVTTIDEYEYNDTIRKVVKHKSTNTLDELVETNTIYHTGNSPFSQNRIAEISEMNITKNGVLIGKSKVNYATNWGTNQSHLPAYFESSKGTQDFYVRNRILAYDQFSNPTEVQQENGTTTTYIWGYNKTQVIAQIVNATNTQVATTLGVSNVHQLTEANLTAINNLRTNATFTNCFITTAEYTPLVGINKVTDPKGDFMTYHYDNFNRLIHVKDRLGNILTESQYHTAVNSSDLNFVLNTTYKQATTSSLANPTIAQANQHKVFIDGLGRPIQEIAHRQSNTGNDIISYIEYDEFGRRTKNYMPFADGTASLNHRPQAQAKVAQEGFYNTPAYQNTTNAYTESRHEASPLQRVLEQAAPGEDWHINAAIKHTVRYEYQTNLALDNVRKLRAIADENTLATSGFYGISLNQSGFYGSGELYKTITKNENWKPSDIDRNTTHEYRNREGQVLLIRTFGDSEVNSGEDDSYQIHDTYYVYDQYGNLTYMIPPKADGTTITTTVLNNLCYQYRYDHKNRLVEKKLPQKHWEFLVYDKLDRVVAMGPALSPFMDAAANTNGWLIAKYDAMNRKIISAWMTGTLTSVGRLALQNDYNNDTVIHETKSSTNTTVNSVAFRYTNVARPTANYHILTVNYFDDYNFPDAPTTYPTVLTQATFYNNTTNRPKGLATGSWIRVLENQTQVRAERSFVLYDNKARAIRTRKTNYLSTSATTGYTQVDAQLDFAGKTLVSEIRHKRLSETERLIREVFTYTAQDRLRKHTHQVNGGTIQLMALYSYNELGQMINKRVGGTDNANPTGLQKVDYTYNIRGWLTDINNVNNLNNGSDPQDVFAYKMNYNQTQNDTGHEVDAQYNGNISETYWRTSSDNTVRKYGFKYDHLNRLKEAKFQQPNDINPVPGKYDERLRYDKNGNITYLYRTGQNGTPIDDLTYQYFGNSNRLMVVQENPITNTPGFESKEVLPQDYFYDTYGNLTRDLNKRIGTSTTNGYTYNHLNQPIRLVKGTSNMQLFYNAAGQKVKKVVLQNGVTTTTDYLDGFQYKNTTLEFFGHAEGFVANNSGTLRYVFQYKDQVGNVRVSYAANTSGVATILEENHYYPYGLKHAGYGVSASVANDGHKYRYNSREFHDELGLEMTAMDFRMYDNILGRFFGMDALSEKNHYLSTYQFGDGNPVVFSDPSGLDSEWGNNRRGDGIGFYDGGMHYSDRGFSFMSNGNGGSGGGGGHTTPQFDNTLDLVNYLWHNSADGVNTVWQRNWDGSFSATHFAVYSIAYQTVVTQGEMMIGDMREMVITNKKVITGVNYFPIGGSGIQAGSSTSFIDGFQTVLDVAGLFPGFGEFADGVNALIYLGRGDYTNAGLSGMAMIPFAGWGATGTKFGNKINNAIYPAFKETSGIAKASGTGMPNSAYNYISKDGTLVSRYFYNDAGKVEFQIDFRDFNSPFGVHGHQMNIPGNLGSGHNGHHVPFMLIPKKYW